MRHNKINVHKAQLELTLFTLYQTLNEKTLNDNKNFKNNIAMSPLKK